MAAYRNKGATIIPTDDVHEESGECIVLWQGCPPVHLECKRKGPKSIRPRAAKRNFERVRDCVFRLMTEVGCSASVIITSRYDPTEEDLPRIAAHVGELLRNPRGYEGCILDGKLSLQVSESPIQELAPGRFALVTPRGFDFAVAEGQLGNDKGEGRWGKCFAWRTKQRWRWIRSGLSELKKAATKIPKDEAGVVYLQIPRDTLPVAWLRMRVMAEEVRLVLEREHKSISAVVVTGEGHWLQRYVDSVETSAVISSFYEVIENANARIPLPKEFRLLGRDFKIT
ncbi:MAG: hypothetical protein KJ000_24685 [Pirellulaceae bacterium]|nr:hypothetical protein [Pirellulaceae bacterium]